MQTFFTRFQYLPAMTDLDDGRLGKQRIEALQTLRQIVFGEGGYPKHPINLMWHNHPLALVTYGMAACTIWSFHRGFKDSCFWEFQKIAVELHKAGWQPKVPPWQKDKDLVRSHRSNLIRKQPERYKPMFNGTPENLPYLWPVTTSKDEYVLRLSKADKVRLESGERTLPASMTERVDNLD